MDPVVPERPASRYASALSRARALGLGAAIAIAPLGALAGSVAACGGAAPVRADPYGRAAPQGAPPPPVTTIEPPAAPGGSVAPPETPKPE